jgi:serine/threonine protein kinase
MAAESRKRVSSTGPISRKRVTKVSRPVFASDQDSVRRRFRRTFTDHVTLGKLGPGRKFATGGPKQGYQVYLRQVDGYRHNIVLKVYVRTGPSCAWANSVARELHMLTMLAGHIPIVRLHSSAIYPSDGIAYLYLSAGHTDVLSIISEWQDESEADLLVVLPLWLQMAQAVQVLHAYNIAHRDLKPENFVCNKGKHDKCPWVEVRLIDFEMACHMTEDGPAIVGHICGSAPFSSFEMAHAACTMPTAAILAAFTAPREKWPWDPIKNDMWSLGVLFYQMVTSALPFGQQKLDEDTGYSSDIQPVDFLEFYKTIVVEIEAHFKIPVEWPSWVHGLCTTLLSPEDTRPSIDSLVHVLQDQLNEVTSPDWV